MHELVATSGLCALQLSIPTWQKQQASCCWRMTQKLHHRTPQLVAIQQHLHNNQEPLGVAARFRARQHHPWERGADKKVMLSIADFKEGEGEEGELMDE
eukprot:143681-Pelagomonas_calceolata.AAC.2